MKIRLFETFAGIGSQHKALHNLEKQFNFETELVGIAEWDINSMQAYQAIHFPDVIIQEEDVLPQFQALIEQGYVVSADTKNPVKDIKKLKNKLVPTYQAIKTLNNFTTVTLLKDKVKEIKNTDIFTYSFPCQAISLQGKQEGLTEDSGTSSSLLWSIRDYLKAVFEKQERQELNDFGEKIVLPKYLLMENVAALYNAKNKDEWNRFKDFLTSIGYQTEEVILKASHFGVPQNRERAFALSVLNDDGILKDFKMLENTHLPCQPLSAFLVVDSIDEARKQNLIFDDKYQGKYQVQKSKFKDAKTTKNGIRKITLEDYTTFQSENMVYHSEGIAPTITAQGAQSRLKVYDEKLDVIRYLNAEEHLKLMGFQEDYQQLKGFNETLLKKMAGNSIVVNVLEAIFKLIVEKECK